MTPETEKQQEKDPPSGIGLGGTVIPVLAGVAALAIGHVVSYYVYPIPHLVIGPALGIAALLCARFLSTGPILIGIGVAAPFAISAAILIPQLVEIAREYGTEPGAADIAVALSPLAWAVGGSVIGHLLRRRRRA